MCFFRNYFFKIQDKEEHNNLKILKCFQLLCKFVLCSWQGEIELKGEEQEGLNHLSSFYSIFQTNNCIFLKPVF